MPRFWLRALLAAAVHDLGKACEGFQAVLRGGPRFPHRHEVLSGLFLPWILGDDADGDMEWVAAAVLTHHKDLRQVKDLYPTPDVWSELPDGLSALNGQITQEFVDCAQRVFVTEIWPAAGLSEERGWADNCQRLWQLRSGIGPLRHVVSTAAALQRRIGKLDYRHQDVQAGRFLRGVMLLADHAGSARERIRFLEALGSVTEVERLFGPPAGHSLYPHQEASRDIEGNAVLMAPTGSGKTECALFWAARQSSKAQGKPVLFYVLPYQASLNAMRSRLAGKFRGEDIGLQHGKALQVLYRQLLEREYSPVAAEAVARKQKALARLGATPIRLLTPYQLLRAAFQLKGHEAVWTDAAGANIVFDEIHAYEPKRLGMILGMVRHLVSELGSRVFVMSATMPGPMLRVVQESLGASAKIRADAKTYEQFRRHLPILRAGELLDEGNIQAMAAAYRGGQSVLAVATTVKRAQELRKRLETALNEPVELLHGRFHSEDRARKEMALLAKMGVGRASDRSPCILVATQVVEVSLNIDFDVLYSDPAPLEALLQRFGRVNRDRAKAGSVKPVNVMQEIPEGCPVYQERLVRAAISELEQVAGEPLDEAHVQRMLDSIYSGSCAEEWLAAVRAAMERFNRDVLSQSKPFETNEALEEMFEEMFDGYEVLPGPLLDEYRKRMDERPLSAAGLTVPITTGQFHMLRGKGLIGKEEGLVMANCPYDSNNGLDVTAPVAPDGI